MELTVSVVGDELGREVRSLRGWLDRDDTLRGRAGLRRAAIADHEMGGASDVLAVALSPEAVAAFVVAFSTWLRSRRSDISVRITGKRTTVEISVDRIQDVQEVLERVSSIIDEVK